MHLEGFKLISNESKAKILNSFDMVVDSVENLRDVLENEGKRAFSECNHDDIDELLTYMTLANKLEEKVDKLREKITTYSLDLATETHPAEFPLGNTEIIESDTKSDANNADATEEYPVNAVINYLDTQIGIKITNEHSYILQAPATIPFEKKEHSPEFCKRLAKLTSQECVTIINQDDGQLIVVNKPITFFSANSLMSFIKGEKVINSDEFIHRTVKN
jgi:hypothetical protein